jgi:hypothetical protein
MVRRTISKGERAYIQFHEAEPFNAMRDLILDLKKAKRRVYSLAIEHDHIADMLEEVLALEDAQARILRIKQIIELSRNFTVIPDDYESLRAIASIEANQP